MTLRLSHIPKIAAVFVAMIAITIVFIRSEPLRDGLESFLRGGGINRVDDARRSLVYRLDVERPTRFNFTGERDLVRILSSVSIEENAPSAELGWTYGYRIRFLDGGGTVLDERDVYSRGRLPDPSEAEDTYRFLRTSDEQIGVQNEIVLEAPSGTAALSLLALDADSGVVGIDVRTYERQPLTESGALVAFLRRSPAEQRRLTQGSAFPADTLTDQEMVTVSRNNWRPVGPSGIAGEAYQLVVMYEIDLEKEQPEVVATP